MRLHKTSLNDFPWIEIVVSLITISYIGACSYLVVQDKNFQQVRKFKSYIDINKITLDTCEKFLSELIKPNELEALKLF